MERVPLLSNFKTKCKNCDSCFTFPPLGSSRVSKEAEIFKELKFLGLGRCFSVRIEESSKTSKIQPKTAILGWFFQGCSILAEKQRPKPKNSSSLKFFAPFDTLLDPRGMKVRNEMIREANTPVCSSSCLATSHSNEYFSA